MPRAIGANNIFKASLLSEDREVKGLPWLEPGRDRHRLDVVRVGNGDVEADGDERLGLNPSLAMDDRLGIAVVGDPLERDVAEPSRRLARDLGEPEPILRRCCGRSRRPASRRGCLPDTST